MILAAGNRFARVIFALPLLAMSGLALAAVEGAASTFYYNAYGGFKLDSQSASVPPPVTYVNENDWYKNNAPVPESGYYMELDWGDAGSNLQLLEVHSTPPVPNPVYWKQSILENDGEHLNGSVTVDDSFGSLMGYLTHFNNVISTAFTGTVNVHWHLDLYDNEAKSGAPIWQSPEMDFELEILETTNYPDFPATCAGGFSVPCPDRFRYRMPGGAFGDTIDQPMGGFAYNGIPYLIHASGFYDEAGNLSGEFWSQEDAHNHAFVNFTVQAVPEPLSYLAMAMGIPLVAYAVRRRRLSSNNNS